MPGAPPGLSALFVSDIHAWTAGALRAVGLLLDSSDADLLLLGGDYLERLALAAAWGETLGRGAFPLGRFAVWGNNDRRGRDLLRTAMDRAGVCVLENAHVLLWAGRRSFAVAGVLDPHRDRPDVDGAIAGIPDETPLVLLAHSPDVLLRPGRDAGGVPGDSLPPGRPMAVLAGHCHGGQIAVPGLPPLWAHARVGRRLAAGRLRIGAAEVLVGRGIGSSLLPVRTVPPEVYRVRLGV